MSSYREQLDTMRASVTRQLQDARRKADVIADTGLRATVLALIEAVDDVRHLALLTVLASQEIREEVARERARGDGS